MEELTNQGKGNKNVTSFRTGLNNFIDRTVVLIVTRELGWCLAEVLLSAGGKEVSLGLPSASLL